MNLANYEMIPAGINITLILSSSLIMKSRSRSHPIHEIEGGGISSNKLIFKIESSNTYFSLFFFPCRIKEVDK